MSGLSAGLRINAALSGDAVLAAKVGSRIYPIATVVETQFPFIVFSRDSVTEEMTKDGRIYDDVSCTVYVMAETYSESVEIAEEVRRVMEDERTLGAEMSGAVEAYSENTFVQQIQFTFEEE